jgi:ribosome-binding protein aMBF1 (putative translation factor)
MRDSARLLAPASLAVVIGSISSTTREVVACEHCGLVQFKTDSAACRRCYESLQPPLSEEKTKQEDGGGALLASHKALTDEEMYDQLAAGLTRAVKALRALKRLSQTDLGKRMNRPRTYISKIERGRIVPTFGSLIRIARGLQVDMLLLFWLILSPELDFPNAVANIPLAKEAIKSLRKL